MVGKVVCQSGAIGKSNNPVLGMAEIWFEGSAELDRYMKNNESNTNLL